MVPPDLPGLHHEYARSDPLAWAGLAAMWRRRIWSPGS